MYWQHFSICASTSMIENNTTELQHVIFSSGNKINPKKSSAVCFVGVDLITSWIYEWAFFYANSIHSRLIGSRISLLNLPKIHNALSKVSQILIKIDPSLKVNPKPWSKRLSVSGRCWLFYQAAEWSRGKYSLLSKFGLLI